MKLFLKSPFWALLILVVAACANTTAEQSDVSTSKDPVLVMFYTEN